MLVWNPHDQFNNDTCFALKSEGLDLFQLLSSSDPKILTQYHHYIYHPHLSSSYINIYSIGPIGTKLTRIFITKFMGFFFDQKPITEKKAPIESFHVYGYK